MPDFLHFRSDRDLNRQLDAKVKELRKQGLSPRIASKSAIVRTLLKDGLGSKKRTIVLAEALLQVQQVSKAAAVRALKIATGQIDEILAEELEEI